MSTGSRRPTRPLAADPGGDDDGDDGEPRIPFIPPPQQQHDDEHDRNDTDYVPRTSEGEDKSERPSRPKRKVPSSSTGAAAAAAAAAVDVDEERERAKRRKRKKDKIREAERRARETKREIEREIQHRNIIPTAAGLERMAAAAAAAAEALRSNRKRRRGSNVKSEPVDDGMRPQSAADLDSMADNVGSGKKKKKNKKKKKKKQRRNDGDDSGDVTLSENDTSDSDSDDDNSAHIRAAAAAAADHKQDIKVPRMNEVSAPIQLFDASSLNADDSRRYPGSDPEWCYMCNYGQRKSDSSTNPRFAALKNYVRESMGRISEKVWLREAQKKYDTELRPWSSVLEERLPWWQSCIYRHFTQHSSDYVIAAESKHAVMTKMLGLMESSSIQVRDNLSGDIGINHKGVDTYLKVFDRWERIGYKIETLRNSDLV